MSSYNCVDVMFYYPGNSEIEPKDHAFGFTFLTGLSVLVLWNLNYSFLDATLVFFWSLKTIAVSSTMCVFAGILLEQYCFLEAAFTRIKENTLNEKKDFIWSEPAGDMIPPTLFFLLCMPFTFFFKADGTTLGFSCFLAFWPAMVEVFLLFGHIKKAAADLLDSKGVKTFRIVENWSIYPVVTQIHWTYWLVVMGIYSYYPHYKFLPSSYGLGVISLSAYQISAHFFTRFVLVLLTSAAKIKRCNYSSQAASPNGN